MLSRMIRLSLLMFAALLPVAAQTSSDLALWQKDLADWRAADERQIAAPDGWLTLVGLDWLKPGFNSVGSASESQIKLANGPAHLGLLTVAGKTVQLLAPTGGFPAGLTVDDQPAREGALQTGAKPSVLKVGSLSMIIIERGGRYAVRIKDANSPTRTGFHGLNWYAADPHFRIEALWIPYTPVHVEKIPTVIGTTLELPAPGVAEFSLNGSTYRLEPVLEGGEDKTLFFILRDLTSQTTTYQAARFLHTGLPSHGLSEPGVLVLDFNRLENPPCAYTPYATCPLPPEQNRLSVAIEAGEKRYTAEEPVR